MSIHSPWLDAQLTGLCDSHLKELQLPEQNVLTHIDVAADLQALVEAAYAEGFEFSIASGFRDFQRQKASGMANSPVCALFKIQTVTLSMPIV